MRSHEGPVDGSTEGEPLATTLALIYKDLDHHRTVVQALSSSSSVATVEFSVQAPLYKGSARIIEGLRSAGSLADKIDVYFKHAICDEGERVRFARLFQQTWTKKNPRAERQDLFEASGDVFAFSFDLVPPMQLDVPREAFDAIAAGPHDAGLLAKIRGGDSPERWHLKVQVRLFLDHAMNPRRHDVPDVAAAAKALDEPNPYVLEIAASPAIPGYARYVLEPLVQSAGGHVVWLLT
ncbi:MAG: hypothetical protein Q8O67_22845 [Deltaproteobacteria bacterium]|nr:hypothetical protein [Deltaproteobacteria bacterium]